MCQNSAGCWDRFVEEKDRFPSEISRKVQQNVMRAMRAPQEGGLADPMLGSQRKGITSSS